MNVLIIEDETPAAEKLERFILRYDATIAVLATIKSVENAINWFKSNDNHPDLVFMDIQLLDGKSFEIFNHTEINSPIIFTTAYDEYALEAFKVNSIAYLLKPYAYDDLVRAMQKAEALKNSFGESLKKEDFIGDLLKQLNQSDKSYKTRFMVKIGDHIKTIPTERIRLFFAEGRTAYIVTDEGKKFIIDFNLEKLEELLHPHTFLRVNRSFILNINCIKDVIVYSNSRLKVIPDQVLEREIIISREKVPVFKKWMDDAPD